MATNPFDLTGKVALVTGANSGLGFGFARGLARAGADVAIWGRRAGPNAEAAEKLREFGTRITAYQVDVSDEPAVIGGVQAVLADFGRIDTVVANAGITTTAPFHKMTSAMYHELLGVSLHGVFYTLREVAAHMIARAEAGDRGGSMIICGSGSIFQGVPTIAHYAVAKGGVFSLSKTLAAELGPYGIRCNVLAPGFIHTEMTLADPEIGAQVTQYTVARTPLGRVGMPDDLEGACVYLASDASRFHTGDTLMIDGGKLNAH